ncbi:hypothetical protein PHYC_02945 [Phycisphaerales bacterium]|nr:hypothetical protein PHYC_02945 [Phycisphaerales bacterium]
MTQIPPLMPGPIGEKKKGLSTGAIVGIVIGGAAAVLLICGGLLVALMLPVLGTARQAARQAVAQSNLRVVSMALTTYAMDNNQWLPEEGANLAARLAPYGVSSQMFQGIDPPPVGPMYYYVPQGRIDRVNYPATTIVLYENPQSLSKLGWSVVFVDGSVHTIKDPAQYRMMIDGITLPDGTPYTPHTK